MKIQPQKPEKSQPKNVSETEKTKGSMTSTVSRTKGKVINKMPRISSKSILNRQVERFNQPKPQKA